MMEYIIGRNGKPRRARNDKEWLTWWQANPNRHVAHDQIVIDPNDSDNARTVTISTVFLGLDHNFFADGPPILWETMIFGLPNEAEYQSRYASKEAALEGHAQAITYARTRLNAKERL